MKDFIIVANGDFLVSEIIHEAIHNKIIIALDHAADKLASMNIIPHVLLGDLDSINKDQMQYWGIKKSFADLSDTDAAYTGNHGVIIVPSKDQNFPDLVKAIHYCDEQAADSITIICALGGRLDLHEATLRSLRSEYKKNRPIILHTEQQTVTFAKDETLSMMGVPDDKCGIFAFPSGKFSSQGLTYDVTDYALNFGFSESIANSMRLPRATLIITGEALIIMPPQLPSQREFMKKTEVERLEMLLRDARMSVGG